MTALRTAQLEKKYPFFFFCSSIGTKLTSKRPRPCPAPPPPRSYYMRKNTILNIIIIVKITTDSQATFYPKNRFSLNYVRLFSISILIFKNNKKLNSSSGIRVLTLQKHSYFEFWPKMGSYLSGVEKIFLTHLLMLTRYFQLVH